MTAATIVIDKIPNSSSSSSWPNSLFLLYCSFSLLWLLLLPPNTSSHCATVTSAKEGKEKEKNKKTKTIDCICTICSCCVFHSCCCCCPLSVHLLFLSRFWLGLGRCLFFYFIFLLFPSFPSFLALCPFSTSSTSQFAVGSSDLEPLPVSLCVLAAGKHRYEQHQHSQRHHYLQKHHFSKFSLIRLWWCISMQCCLLPVFCFLPSFQWLPTSREELNYREREGATVLLLKEQQQQQQQPLPLPFTDEENVCPSVCVCVSSTLH